MAYPLVENVREVIIGRTALVRKFTYEDGTIQYDWVGESDDSDEWFETIEDAVYDAQLRG